RIESLKEAALKEYLATDAARRAAALSLVAQLAEQYLALCELDERLAIAGATVASRSESLRIFTRRYEVGSISRLDLTQVETLLRQAQVLQAQLEQSRSAQLHALALLLGTTPLMPQTLHLDDDAVQRELRAGLPSALLLRRPDILAAEHRLRAANADIGAARAAFFPSLSLTGAYGTASTELDGLFESGGLAWSFSPQLSLPIFDRGRRRAALEVAELRRDEAVASYERAIQTAFREVSDALSAQRWLQQQTRFLQEALDVQSERARLAQLRYDAGAAPYLEVLDAQRELLAAEQQLVQARRAALSARVQLYAALGGGTQDAAVAATE
ncbi:MAG: efflux transporter outer membrane subunit, partial [Pseudomonadota bacterium]